MDIYNPAAYPSERYHLLVELNYKVHVLHISKPRF